MSTSAVVRPISPRFGERRYHGVTTNNCDLTEGLVAPATSWPVKVSEKAST